MTGVQTCALPISCERGHEGRGHAPLLPGLGQGRSRPRRLTPITLQAFMCLEAPALSGFGVLFGVSYAGGHSVLLQTVLLAMHGEKDTMSPKELDFKNFHGPHTVSPRSWPP